MLVTALTSTCNHQINFSAVIGTEGSLQVTRKAAAV
jgi:hypothetical protein